MRASPASLASSTIHLTLSVLCAVFSSFPARATEPAAVDPAWVEYVGPLLGASELEVYLELERGFDRSAFAEAFWAALDPDPATPVNELRHVWSQRRAVAETRFHGLDNDRSRAFLLHGPPRYILEDLCADELWPLEIWVYGDDDREIDSTIVFFSPPDAGRPRQWDPDEDGRAKLLSVPAPSGDAKKLLQRTCRRGEEILGALERALAPEDLGPRAAAGWLESFTASRQNADGMELDCRLALHFPGSIDNRSIVDGTLTIELPELRTAASRFDLGGEIFRGDRRADQFRYQFEISPPAAAGAHDFVFRRHLPPGDYRLLLVVRDQAEGRSRQLEQRLLVPASIDPARPGPGSGHAAGTESSKSLTIRPLPVGLLIGRQRVDVRTSNPRIEKVRFLLNGQPVMTKGRPPFSVEIDLGPAPRTHLLEAIGVDHDDREVARDRLPVNLGPHRFGVRLLEPRRQGSYRGELLVRAEVDVPAEEKLDRLELYWNDSHRVTLYQPPFVQPHFEVPSDDDVGYVRAVAVLADGLQAEDLVIVNAPGSVDRVQVDYVELFATVVNRRGETVEDLSLEEFKVTEDGKEQHLRRLETVRNLSISAALAVDTSTSMSEKMAETEKAARRFLSAVVRPRDRAAVIVFNDQPHLVVPLTNDVGRLAAGLSGIEASGETTLYDAVLFGLYYLSGLPGKRVLVLLSDGVDSESRHTFDETLEFARRSGTAIHAIGIGISPRDIEGQRVLRLLARETGGSSFFVDSAQGLGRVYEQIENELRSQYLIGYQSTSSGTAFRRVDLTVTRRGLKARTAPGYYP